MTRKFNIIAFDADDTLWHSESLYAAAQSEYRQLLGGYAAPDQIDRVLHDTEMRNLPLYGYGIKGFALSMIEAALDISASHIQGHEVQRVLQLARHMLSAELQLLDHAAEIVAQLAETYPLMLITKGDLFDQESKIERSGLKPYFHQIEIVSDKTPRAYAALLAKHNLEPAKFLMVGNSLRSDILPVVELGGYAIHIPYHITWAHEHIEDTHAAGYETLEHLGQLPAAIERLSRHA
ncbi:MAG: HAD family hydrolase [Chloroflexi bacterium]|nr:HAD family hydrolase [Chloroflexota bacterium]